MWNVIRIYGIFSSTQGDFMTVEVQSIPQQFKFPSKDTIRALIGPYPVTSDVLSGSARERVINAVIEFFANQTKTQEEISVKVREIIAQNASGLSKDTLNDATQQLTQSLMHIISGYGKTLWDSNARQPTVFYHPSDFQY
jgi:hypothetical protein